MALKYFLWILLSSTASGQFSSPLMCSHEFNSLPAGTLAENGSLITVDGSEYPPHSWKMEGDGTFKVCKCIIRQCFRKCCQEGQAFASNKDITCVNDSTVKHWPTVYNEDLIPFIHGNMSSRFDNHFEVLFGNPCNGEAHAALEDELHEFHLLSHGVLRAWDGEEMFNHSNYCYEVILGKNVWIPFFCPEDQANGTKSNQITPTKYVLNAVGMLLSAPFLAATFVIYALLPSLHTVHGRSLMSHVLALLTVYICTPIVGFHLSPAPEFCSAIAFIIYFAFLASFFWLNVMCLDIWWTFSGFRPMRGSVKEREHKKFIIYSLYCWGSPLIMLIICMVMDLHPDIPDSYIKPGFGELKCWFKSNLGNLIYFSGPIAILIVCNIILFILTAVKIQQVKRGTKILKKQDSRRHNEEEENNAQRFNLYFKLFLVMGVNWIMEIVSFAAGGPDEYWYITDIANTLQGVLIFIIFVWKDRIRKLLMERFCPGRAANTNSLNNSSSTRTTGIRHNGSVMSSHRPSFKNKDDYQMKTLTSPSARSDDSDVA